jgi:hypothetical protein
MPKCLAGGQNILYTVYLYSTKGDVYLGTINQVCTQSLLFFVLSQKCFLLCLIFVCVLFVQLFLQAREVFKLLPCSNPFFIPRQSKYVFQRVASCGIHGNVFFTDFSIYLKITFDKLFVPPFKIIVNKTF